VGLCLFQVTAFQALQHGPFQPPQVALAPTVGSLVQPHPTSTNVQPFASQWMSGSRLPPSPTQTPRIFQCYLCAKGYSGVDKPSKSIIGCSSGVHSLLLLS
jgi:hypothetical protein